MTDYSDLDTVVKKVLDYLSITKRYDKTFNTALKELLERDSYIINITNNCPYFELDGQVFALDQYADLYKFSVRDGTLYKTTNTDTYKAINIAKNFEEYIRGVREPFINIKSFLIECFPNNKEKEKIEIYHKANLEFNKIVLRVNKEMLNLSLFNKTTNEPLECEYTKDKGLVIKSSTVNMLKAMSEKYPDSINIEMLLQKYSKDLDEEDYQNILDKFKE